MHDNNAGLYGRNGVLPAKLALREGKKSSCMMIPAVIISQFFCRMKIGGMLRLGSWRPAAQTSSSIYALNWDE